MARLFTSAEAAEYLAVSEDQLEHWRRNGKGPDYIKLGHRSVRYEDSQLERFVNAHRVSGAREPEPQDGQSTGAPEST